MEERCRIMIVDDEFIMRQGIKFMVKWEENGYQVVAEASNGKEALQMIAEKRPQIILCDIAMPILNGLDFIKLCISQYPDMKIVVLSGYDNFEYVREALLSGAVDYVLKPTLTPEQLLDILRRVAQTIPNVQLPKQASLDYINPIAQYLLGESETIPLAPAPLLRVFFVPLQSSERKQAKLFQMLHEKTMECLGKLDCEWTSFVYQQEKLCVVLYLKPEQEQKVVEQLTQFMEQASQMIDHVFAVLSPSYGGFPKLKKDFFHLMQIEGFYHEGCPLYQPKSSEPLPVLERFDYRKFASYIAEKRYSDAQVLLHTYLIHAITCQLSEQKLKTQTKNFLYNLMGDSEQSEIEQICLQGFDQIEKAAYAEEFLQVVERILSQFEQLLDTEPTNAYMEKILDYIRENYTEDLNLQALAEQFNFGYSYLSAYFNQYAHEGFSEYLNRIRIEKACEILINTKDSIAQVSCAVGYSDHSYFCRVFKKITGVTPSHYRKGHS